MQSFLANQAVAYLMKECNTEVHIKYLDTDFFETVRVKHLSISDHHNNKMVEADEARISFASLLALQNKLSFKRLSMNAPKINLRIYKDEQKSNLMQWINCFPKSETKKDVYFALQNTQINNGYFSYINENSTSEPVGKLNFQDVELSQINTKINRFELINDSIVASIEKLNFFEKSGFDVKKLNGKINIGHKTLYVANLHLNANDSKLNFPQLNFDFDHFGQFRHFTDSVKMDGEIISSLLNMSNLAYFHKPLEEISETYNLDAIIRGTVRDLKVFNANIKKKGDVPLEFSGSLSALGLPDVKNTFFDVTASQLTVNKESLEQLQLLKLANVSQLKLPQNLRLLGTVKGKGHFRGYLQGFMSQMDVSTNLGNLLTDLNFYYDSYEDKVVYDGNMSTKSFNLGKLYGVKELGRISGSANVNATGLTVDALRTELKANINWFEINGYKYRKITAKGVLEKDIFNGVAKVDDENILLDYAGDINFSDSPPHYNFIAEARHVNLDKLGFSEKPSSISANIYVDGTGSNLDNLLGKFLLSNVDYAINYKSYHLDSVNLVSLRQADNTKDISLQSDLVDADIKGDFKPSNLLGVFYNMLANVMPKKLEPKESYERPKDEVLDFRFDLKNISLFMQMFYPEIYVSRNAVIKGHYESNLNYFDLFADIDTVSFGGMTFHGIDLETYLSELYEIELDIDSVTHAEVTVPNVSLFTAVYENNFGMQLLWKDSANMSGNINGNGYWNEVGNFHFELVKSSIFSPEQHWHLTQKAVFNELDSMRFGLDGLYVTNGAQNISVKGILGHKPEDKLEIVLDSVNLKDILPVRSIDIEGVMNANATVQSIFHKPMFSGFIESDISVNKSELGHLSLRTDNTNNVSNMNIIGLLQQDGKDALSIIANYNYKSDVDPLSAKFQLKNLQIEPIHPFLPKTLKDLKGEISGNLSLIGDVSTPSFEGNLSVKNGNISISELNTSYTFDAEIEVTPDLIYTTSGYAYDKFNTQARILSASFFHEYFTDFSYEFLVAMNQPFLALNTTIQENDLFYGTAFATGMVSINYDKYNELEITVEAKSEKNTEITLPLYGAEEVSIGHFVSFVDFSDTTKIQEDKVNLSGITMNFDFIATPDAKLNLVFDDIVGDKITAYGNGSIFMEIDQYDQFKMYGQYVLEKGDYLFTLKNLINKKFTLKKGGTLNWYGDPYNAEIDVEAVYSVKASVADLFPPEERYNYNTKQDVDCYLMLSNNLFNPSIGFGIELPRSSENVRSVLRSNINTTEELNRQFFSLLLLNKFLPRQNSAVGSIGSGVTTSTSEVLTSQVSQMLNQWWEGVDIGINYESGDEMTNEEYAVALSTQLFNDKLQFSGNFGVSQNNQNRENSSLIGDVSLEYMLDEKGVFRIRAFNQSNTFDPTRNYQGNYTQGVGINYQKSFNSFNELLFWSKIRGLFGAKK